MELNKEVQQGLSRDKIFDRERTEAALHLPVMLLKINMYLLYINMH